MESKTNKDDDTCLVNQKSLVIQDDLGYKPSKATKEDQTRPPSISHPFILHPYFPTLLFPTLLFPILLFSTLLVRTLSLFSENPNSFQNNISPVTKVQPEL